MCLLVSYKKKYVKQLFASLKSLKKGVGSGSGSFSQRYGSVDPDPHQNVTDLASPIFSYVMSCADQILSMLIW
jgi:hypothetical protein